MNSPSLTTNYARKLSGLIALILAGLALSSQAMAVGYTITDLGSLGMPGTFIPYDINSSGVVVGSYRDSIYVGGYNTHGFMYSSTMQTLPVLGAYAINDAGTIAGATPSNGFGWRAFSGAPSNFISGQSYSAAYAINSYGVAVGGGGSGQGFSTVSSGIGTLGGAFSLASGINDNGVIVGGSTYSSNQAFDPLHAFVLSGALMKDIGTLGGQTSFAYDINNSNVIVGRADTSAGVTHAFSYSEGQIKDLGSLGSGHGSIAWSINNLGQAVGGDVFGQISTPGGYYSLSKSSNSTSAVLFDVDGVHDLNTLIAPDSGWILSSATAINDKGLIVGTGYNGRTSSMFLLTPVSVPVPAAAWLLGSGLLGLIGVARKKSNLV